MEISDQMIQCREASVHALGCGDPAGRAVVLLHGMKFQAATWQELGTLDALAGLGFRVLALDMPGFGKSPASSVAPVTVLADCLDRLGLDRVALIGPSMGGRIALEFAIAHPRRVTALVVVGAVGVRENRAGLAAITAPTLVVWGEADAVSPLDNSDILLAELPDARREIYPQAPHPCYLGQPDRWHASLETFLTAVNA